MIFGETMKLGKEIALLRKNAGFTQVELSKKTKIGLRLIRYIEQGGNHFRYDKLEILLKFLGYGIEIIKEKTYVVIENEENPSEQLQLNI